MSVNTRSILHKILESKKQAPRPHAGNTAGTAVVFFLFACLSIGILIFQVPSVMESREYVIGEPAPRTLFSPIEVTYINEDLTRALREKKAAAVPMVFERVPSAENEARENWSRFAQAVKENRAAAAQGGQDQKKLPFILSEGAMKFLSATPRFEEFAAYMEEVLTRIFAGGVVDPAQKQDLAAGGMAEITDLGGDPKGEKNVLVMTLQTPEDAKAMNALPDSLKTHREFKGPGSEILGHIVKPNLKHNEAETRSRKAKAAEAVAPVEKKIQKDELVLQRGMLVSVEGKERFEQVRKKMAAKKVLNQLFAVADLVVLIYFLAFIYLMFFERKFFKSLRMNVLLLGVIGLTLALSKAVLLWPGSSPYLMPVTLAPLLLALLAGPRIGFLSASLMAVLSAPLAGFAPEVILMTLISGIVGAFGTIKLRKRIQFLKVGALIGGSSFLILLIYRIYREYPFQESLEISLQGLANGFLVSMPLCFLLVPILEAIFNLTTDVSLLELSDLNHPLLKKMIVEAPGTYHHSLVVSTLAEAACEAIAANALLARVGCYFHDIGKVPRAEFFTENHASKHGHTAGGRHEKLTPSMSYLVILNHVKDGLELGRQYKLKEPILRFIPEHQGTGVVYYFYRKALDRAKPDEKINPNDYRYPGPKPQSRETAVAMLADSTEAASRSLRDPSPESIRNFVRKVINDKFIDGQLDECDLTLRDLHKIQESFVHNLMAIFHTRVSYPAPLEDPCGQPDLFENEKFLKMRGSEEQQKKTEPPAS